MNEPLFKNSFVIDKQMYKELYRNLFKTPVFLVVYVVEAIQILASFSVSVRSGMTTLLAIISFGLLCVFVYLLNIKANLKRDKERANGQTLVSNLFVYDNRIELEMLGNKDILYFQNIKHASKSKNYIFVQTQANIVYTFKKDSFTLGSSDEFVDFLKSKGIKAQK